MPAIDELGAFGYPEQLPWRHPVQFTVRSQFETAFNDENDFVIEQGPGDLRAFPPRKANPQMRRHVIAQGAGNAGAPRGAAAMHKVQVPVIDQHHRLSVSRRLVHSSLLLFHAAQRIRERTPSPRNGSGGLREGMPVTDWMSSRR
ncbi:hypothetical protein D9M72_606870 [compost metagenome]